MEMKLYRTFLTVAEQGTFTGAAEALNCVQSNVTAQIGRLEAHYGQRLFLRGRGGARLTWFGEKMKMRAQELVHAFDAAEAELMEAAGAAAPLVLGAMETVAASRLPGVLRTLRNRCPEATVSLRTAATSDLSALLWRREIDTALLAGPVDPDRFRTVRAFSEQMVCVSLGGLPDDAPLLAFRTGCSYRTIAERWLATQEVRRPPVVDMGSLDGILGCVEVGLGFAVTPLSAAQTYRGIDRLSLTPLPAPFDRAEIHLAWRHDHQPVAVHRALIGLLTDETGA